MRIAPSLAAACVVAWVAACSSESAHIKQCDACAVGEACALTDDCMAGACAEVECRTRCATDSDCRLGHVCTPFGLCADACTVCPSGLACSGDRGACVGVGCTSDADCRGGAFCDPTSRACYPIDGNCASQACRPLSDAASAAYTRTCRDDYCRIASAVPGSTQGAPLAAGLDPYFPSDDGAFASKEAILFEWEGVGEEVFLFVTEAPASTIAELASAALWGDAVPRGASQVRWTDGVSIDAGTWGTVAGDPPRGVPLYVTLVSIDGVSPAGASHAVPFVVGAWLADGAACSADAECFRPKVPRACVSQRCARRCESHADCAQPLLCGHPSGALALRTCGAP